MSEPERQQLRRLIDRARRVLVGAAADGLMHGTAMAYRKGGCRCETCRLFNAAYKRRWRADHPEQARATNRRYKARRRARSAGGTTA